MNAQNTLPGFAPPLTERQEQALELIRTFGPIRSEDLGARLRELRGGRESGAEFDAGNGRDVGEALHRKELVRYLRREGWVPAGWKGAKGRGGYDPREAEIPY